MTQSYVSEDKPVKKAIWSKEDDDFVASRMGAPVTSWADEDDEAERQEGD